MVTYYKCEKCNVNLEWYGVNGSGQYKYNCPKCYSKYSKQEKGMNDIKEEYENKPNQEELEKYQNATKDLAKLALTQSLLNHFSYVMVIDFLEKQKDDWAPLTTAILEVWKEKEKGSSSDQQDLIEAIDEIADVFIQTLGAAGFDISKLEKANV